MKVKALSRDEIMVDGQVRALRPGGWDGRMRCGYGDHYQAVHVPRLGTVEIGPHNSWLDWQMAKMERFFRETDPMDTRDVPRPTHIPPIAPRHVVRHRAEMARRRATWQQN